MSTHPADVVDILRRAAVLVGDAEAAGVTLRISAPQTPLRMAENNHVVDAWPARNGPKPQPVGRWSGATPQREISDREWAARDPSLREGSTVRVPGVGEL